MDNKEYNDVLEEENIDNENMEEVITLTDEEGNEHKCVILEVLEYNYKNYAALVLADSLDDKSEESDTAELFIMQVDNDGEEEFLKAIDDNENYEEICKIMIERLSDDFEIQE